MGKKNKPGRPEGTTRGVAKRISINISQEHKAYLESKDCSYAKTIAKLIDAAMAEDL